MSRMVKILNTEIRVSRQIRASTVNYAFYNRVIQYDYLPLMTDSWREVETTVIGQDEEWTNWKTIQPVRSIAISRLDGHFGAQWWQTHVIGRLNW